MTSGAPVKPSDEDVQAEAARVKERSGGAMAPSAAVEVRGLVKSFGRQSCGKLFHAVKGPFFEIKKNELFCLLGPNGAGKTTTINMLVGNLPPSEGQALEMGHSVNSPAGIASIRQQMGVCPQFDVQVNRKCSMMIEFSWYRNFRLILI